MGWDQVAPGGIGSLSTLTTTTKASLVAAINEVDAHTDTAQADATQALTDAATATVNAATAQGRADDAYDLGIAAAVDLTATTAPTRASAYPMSGVVYEFRAQGTTMLQVGATGLTITNFENGTASSVRDAAGKFYREASAATNDNAAGFRCLDVLVERDQNPFFFALIRTGNVITHSTLFVCMSANNLPGGATWPNDSIGFGCDTEASEATFQIVSRDTTTQSSTDTNVPYTASHVYALGLKVNGTAVYWSIEDITAGTTTSGQISNKANLPTAATGLGVVSAVLTRENVIKRLDNAIVRVGVL
jgi:hypothetical protein